MITKLMAYACISSLTRKTSWLTSVLGARFGWTVTWLEKNVNIHSVSFNLMVMNTTM